MNPLITLLKSRNKLEVIPRETLVKLKMKEILLLRAVSALYVYQRVITRIRILNKTMVETICSNKSDQ
jgi:hypothetical protein